MKIKKERRNVNFVNYIFVIFLGLVLGIALVFFIRRPIDEEEIKLCEDAYRSATMGDMTAFQNGQVTMQPITEEIINVRTGGEKVRGCVVIMMKDEGYDTKVDYELEEVLVLGLICGALISSLFVAICLIRDFALND